MKKQDVFVILLSALVFFAIIFYIVYKPEKRETYSKVFNGISSSNVNVKLNNSNLAIIHSSKFYVNVDNEHLNVYKRNNKHKGKISCHLSLIVISGRIYITIKVSFIQSIIIILLSVLITENSRQS